jgi:hypothetical protein
VLIIVLTLAVAGSDASPDLRLNMTCAERRAHEMADGTGSQGIGGGFVAAGILSLAGAGIMAFAQSRLDEPSYAVAGAAGVVGLVEILIGGVTMSSGREKYVSAAVRTCLEPSIVSSPHPEPGASRAADAP